MTELAPPVDQEVLILAPELGPRWLRAMITTRRGYSTPRWKVFGVRGIGFDGRSVFMYRDFKPRAWKPIEATS